MVKPQLRMVLSNPSMPAMTTPVGCRCTGGLFAGVTTGIGKLRGGSGVV